MTLKRGDVVVALLYAYVPIVLCTYVCMYVCMYLVRMCRATYIMYGCCKNNQLLSHSTLVALASTLSLVSTLLATTTVINYVVSL